MAFSGFDIQDMDTAQIQRFQSNNLWKFVSHWVVVKIHVVFCLHWLSSNSVRTMAEASHLVLMEVNQCKGKCDRQYLQTPLSFAFEVFSNTSSWIRKCGWQPGVQSVRSGLNKKTLIQAWFEVCVWSWRKEWVCLYCESTLFTDVWNTGKRVGGHWAQAITTVKTGGSRLIRIHLTELTANLKELQRKWNNLSYLNVTLYNIWNSPELTIFTWYCLFGLTRTHLYVDSEWYDLGLRPG